MKMANIAVVEKQSKYRTLKSRSEGFYREKGSKFIGMVVPCYSVEEAKAFLTSWKKEHHQARHLCYAYRFGVDGAEYRANDDGEPSHSAGAPILGQLQSFELTNVLAGVVRYYGGTKLGVGGLINAYRTAAKEAIEAGEIVWKEVFEWIRISFSYEDMPNVMNLLKKYGLNMHQHTFEADCNVVTSLPLAEAAHIKRELNELNSLELEVLGMY